MKKYNKEKKCPIEKGWYINLKTKNCCSTFFTDNVYYTDWKNKMGQIEKWQIDKCLGTKKKVSVTVNKVPEPNTKDKMDADTDKDPEKD